MAEELVRGLTRVVRRGIGAEEPRSQWAGARVVKIFKGVDGSERPERLDVCLPNGTVVELRIRVWRAEEPGNVELPPETADLPFERGAGEDDGVRTVTLTPKGRKRRSRKAEPEGEVIEMPDDGAGEPAEDEGEAVGT